MKASIYEQQVIVNKQQICIKEEKFHSASYIDRE
jgi:hypothetical protein